MEDYIKISELEPTTDLEGLYTIGSDKNNLSKKVALQFLKDAANYANEQGDYAKQVGDTVNGNVGVSDYPEFSASTSYVIGDVVRYNGALYIFTANHAASAWNGNDVKATSINAITSGKLTELESEVNHDILTISGKIKKNISFLAGKEHSSAKDRIPCEIKSGDSFFLKLTSEMLPEVQIYVGDIDGVMSPLKGISSGTEEFFLAERDIYYIGAYFLPQQDGILTLELTTPKNHIVDNSDIVNVPIIEKGIEWEHDKYIYYGGTIVDTGGFLITPCIPCKYGDIFEVYTGGFTSQTICCLAIYDENNNPISTPLASSDLRKIVVTKKESAYVRCVVSTSYFGAFLTINGKRVFEWTKSIYDNLCERLHAGFQKVFFTQGQLIVNNLTKKIKFTKSIIGVVKGKYYRIINDGTELNYSWSTSYSTLQALVYDVNDSSVKFVPYIQLKEQHLVLCSFYGIGTDNESNEIISITNAAIPYEFITANEISYPVSCTYFTHGSDYNGVVDVSSIPCISTQVHIYFAIGNHDKIRFNYKNRNDGNHWLVRVLWFDEKKVVITRTGYVDLLETFERPINAHYFRISFKLVDSNGDDVLYRVEPTDLKADEVFININCMDDENKVIARNSDKQPAIDAIGFAQWRTDFCFAHISDTHGEQSLNQFKDFIKIINEYRNIYFGIVTGDFVYNNFTHTYDYIKDNIAKSRCPILLTIGNHEVGEGNDASFGGTDEEVFDKYIAPNYGNWDVVINSSEKKSYYYKDFTARKIRLIVLNQFETPTTLDPTNPNKYVYYRGGAWYSQEQLDWFIQTLMNMPDGYAALVAKHMPEDAIVGDNPFYCKMTKKVNFGTMSLIDGCPIEDIVDAFQNRKIVAKYYHGCGEVAVNADFTNCNNNEFICYIGGHHHADFVGTLQNYPNQIFMAIECDNTQEASSSQSDLNKVLGRKSMDAINIISVNRDLRKIAIVRVGADATNLGTKREMMSIDYVVA